MSSIRRKKRKKLSFADRFRRSIFKQKINELLTWVENMVQLDRKRAKLFISIVVLIFLFFIDLIWIIIPTFIHEKEVVEYVKEEIPSLIQKHKLTIEKNSQDYKAHYELGKIYLFIEEQEKAKVEFFQAMEYAPPKEFKADFELARMYIDYYKKPEIAFDIMTKIDDKYLSKELVLKKTDYLFDIYKLFFSQNKFSPAHNTLQITYNNYLKLKQKDKFEKAKKELALLLLDMADEAYYKEKNITKTMVYLQDSKKLEESAEIYAKMGYLFFEDPKISADYFEKAYSFNPMAVNYEVFIPAIEKAINICSQENRMADRAYFRSVLERINQQYLSSKIYTKLIANNVKRFYEKIEGKDEYLPVVYVDIFNGFSQKQLPYVKIRAVFVNGENFIVGHQDLIAVNGAEPLYAQKSKLNIRLESNRTITEEQKNNGIYKVILYFSVKRPNEWTYATTKMFY